METVYTHADIPAIAGAILEGLTISDTAQILAFSGPLGAGKTTLTKEIAHILGVQGDITSPTFTVLKVYETRHATFTRLVHIDAYRIEDIAELGPIGFGMYVEDPHTLVVVEWPEQIAATLEGAQWYTISHIDDTHRKIVKK